MFTGLVILIHFKYVHLRRVIRLVSQIILARIVGSRGGTVTSTSLWMNGPQWLPNPDQWPKNVEVEPSSES